MKNPPNIRQNFYQGQNVSATNLNQLQDYSDNARNLIVSDILGYGIVSGFDVTNTNSSLFIDEGLAYTKLGVRLASDKTLNIVIHPSQIPVDNQQLTRYLALSLDYIKEGEAVDSSNNAVQPKWTPTVKATLHLDKTTITANDFLIADITITKDGITDIIKNGQKFLDFNALTQKTSSFTTTKEEANTIASIDADIFKINDKSFADTIRDLSYPLKSTYTQYPNDTTGVFDETETPKTLFGGDWEKQFENESMFFRTEGTLANESRSSSTGIQTDAMQKMTGNISNIPTPTYGLAGSGVLFNSTQNSGSSAAHGYNLLCGAGFDNSRQVRTSTENRPINMLMIIWKRIG